MQLRDLISESKIAIKQDDLVVIENPTVSQIEAMMEKANHAEGLRCIIADRLYVWDGYHATHDEVERLLNANPLVIGHLFEHYFQLDLSRFELKDIEDEAHDARTIIMNCLPLQRFLGDIEIRIDDGQSPDYLMEMELYHGGKDLEYDYREVKSQGKGRWEYGPGLYLTNDRSTAERYSRGSRKMYRVEIELDGAQELSTVTIPPHDVMAFVDRNVKGAKKKEMAEMLKSGMERRGAIYASALVNLCINLEAIQNSKTSALRQFLIDHGADYSLVKSYGGRSGADVYVIFNPKIIKKVSR